MLAPPGTTMNDSDLNRFRDRLTAMLQRVEGTASRAEDQARTPIGGEAGGGISNAPLHLGDLATGSLTQEMGATLLENEIYLHDEIADALERIDAGEFGACEECGDSIPAERLDALPYTRYCVACADSAHAGADVNLNNGRPDEWLGKPGHQSNNETGTPQRVPGRNLGGVVNDPHAAGTPGGGTEVGGLAGTNIGAGEPSNANLEEAMGGGEREAPVIANSIDMPEAVSGSSGGAVGGTPANKRSTASPPRSRSKRKSK
jgi:RNA polymerase-binding transcription factor DksA